ncbi:hypothetical protein [Pengzhenrongella phosphoraccumulans]|jgi:hypothetical protein|uniref:hypothetical protein n=1 Tax=Pengzhenrongella phosphoraccumulans TaxID=3114394 RepID=UPI00388F2ADB
MMRSRGTVIVVGAVAVLGLGASIMAGGAPPTSGPTIPGDGPWAIALDHPQGGWSRCFDDEAVAEAVMSADQPSSSAAATLRTSATKDDVERIATCLDQSLTGGTATITETG